MIKDIVGDRLVAVAFDNDVVTIPLSDVRFKERYLNSTTNERKTDCLASLSLVEAHRDLSVSGHAEQFIITKHIKDYCITAIKLAESSVETAKIEDRNITTAKTATESVTSNELASSSVTSETIVDRAVTSAKLALEVLTADHFPSSLNLGSKTLQVPTPSL